MPASQHRTYKIILRNPSEGEVERLRCLVYIYDTVVIKSDQSTPGLRLVVGTAHSKSQRSMANLQRIFPQAEITIGDAFDFKVQRFYFADEIVTKEFCGIESIPKKAYPLAVAARRIAQPHTPQHLTVSSGNAAN